MEGRPLEERELVLRAQRRGRGRLRGARSRAPGDRIPSRLPHHRQPARGRGRRPGRLRQGLARARALPQRRAVAAVAARASSRTRPATAAARPAGARSSPCGPSATKPRGTRPRSPGPLRRRRPRSPRTSAGACSRRSMRCPRRRGPCSHAATCWSSPRQETAAALGLRRGTVKSRTSRALERLRESYE